MDSHRASLSTQIFYGSGSISVGIKNNLLGTYLLIYYNQVLGLDAGIAALAMAIALAVDAVSDPLVGIWSDRIRTRCCLLYTSPSPRDRQKSRMPSSA